VPDTPNPNYHHGGFGAVRINQPMVLGHEISGVVDAVGVKCELLKVGDRAAVSPSVPCNQCKFCLEGRQNECLDMRFYGSRGIFHRITSKVPKAPSEYRWSRRKLPCGPLVPLTFDALIEASVFHCIDASGRPLLNALRRDHADPTYARDAWHDIPSVVEALRQFWMPIRFKRGT